LRPDGVGLAYLQIADPCRLRSARAPDPTAEYHLRGGGGLSLMKWQSTKSKIDPVIDELLKNSKKT